MLGLDQGGTLARLHLHEFGDSPWMPDVLRSAQTRYLAWAGNLSDSLYRGFATRLAATLRRTGESRILDVGSGAGGPVPSLLRLLKEEGLEVEFHLSDLRPDAEWLEFACREFPGEIRYCSDPVDATTLDDAPPGLLLFCNAFHHFRPEVAREVLERAVEQGRGVAILETAQRSWRGLACMALAPLVFACGLPFVRPFRIGWIPLTYILPILPLLTLWDGWISCLRVYSTPELRELTAKLDTYRWNIEVLPVPGIPVPVTVLIGAPGTGDSDDG